MALKYHELCKDCQKKSSEQERRYAAFHSTADSVYRKLAESGLTADDLGRILKYVQGKIDKVKNEVKLE